MKVIEIDANTNPIVCPFCGKSVAGGTTDEDWEVTPCEHLLFVAVDEGFEYRSKRFNDHMNFPENMEFPNILPEYKGDSIDRFTSKVTIPNAVKYACYTPPPSLMGAYYGFAPL
jgi:hypothetical protein